MSAQIRGALWMSGAVLSFTLMALAGRAASLSFDTFEIMFYRSLVGLIVVATVLRARGRPLPRTPLRRLPLHLARNIAHFIGQNLWFLALTLIPLAQLFALEFTGPIWAMLLAPLVLGEPVRRRALIAGAIGFVGVLVVVQPGAAPISPGTLAAALAALAFGLTANLTRRLTRHDDVLTIMFWLTAMQSVLGLVSAGADLSIALPGPTNAPWLVLIALAGLAAHFCMTMALSLAPAAQVMPIDFFRLPLIAVIGALFYGEPLGWAALCGGTLIIAANLINLGRGTKIIVSKR